MSQTSFGDVTNPFDPVVVGNNTCYMAQGHYPIDQLESILPDKITIPNEKTMKETYPDTKLVDGKHPFMLSFCHGSKIHDVFTKIDVPQQEELMFVFPVMYDNAHLCSYVPVLYLDSALGVAGGLYYGLRKEYHPEMKHTETDHSKNWHIDKIISSSFVQTDQKMNALPQFID